MSKPDTEAVYSLAREVFGQTILAVNEISAGVMNWKYYVQLSSGDEFIIRFFPKARSYLIDFEPDLLRRCLQHGIKVPEVLLDSRTGPTSSCEYIIYRMLIGAALSERLEILEDDDLRDIASELFQQMELMAELNISGFGELINSKQATNQTWREFILEAYKTALPNLSIPDLISPVIKDGLLSLPRVIDQLKPPEKGFLTWGDVSPANVIIDCRNKFVGLIDFEGSLSAEMALNFGYLRATHAGHRFCSFVELFWKNKDQYSAQIDFYTALRALRILRYAHLPLPLGTKRDPIENFLPGLLPALKRLNPHTFNINTSKTNGQTR